MFNFVVVVCFFVIIMVGIIVAFLYVVF